MVRPVGVAVSMASLREWKPVRCVEPTVLKRYPGADGVTVQSQHANFQVDPRLATLLGERYRSTEQALKELVDNAWDADAPNVWITLPGAMTFDPITVRDDGTGMTERELRQEYLKSKSPGTEPLARASARPASTA